MRRSAEENEERANIRANVDKLGIDPRGFQVAVRLTKTMTPGERRDYQNGINATLEVNDFATQFSKYNTGNYDMMTWNYNPSFVPALVFDRFTGAKGTQASKLWTDPEARKLTDELLQTPVDQQQPFYTKLQQLYLKDAPMIVWATGEEVGQRLLLVRRVVALTDFKPERGVFVGLEEFVELRAGIRVGGQRSASSVCWKKRSTSCSRSSGPDSRGSPCSAPVPATLKICPCRLTSRSSPQRAYGCCS